MSITNANPLTNQQARAADLGVKMNVPVIGEFSQAMTGANQNLMNAGTATNYILIQNPTANGPVTINIAGNDASVSGYVLAGGETYINERGTDKQINIHGTAAELIVAFGG